MKSYSGVAGVCVYAVLTFYSMVAQSAPTGSQPVVTHSVFVMPPGPKGRDPFFPKSIRPYGPVVATQGQRLEIVDITFTGIIPAMVNGRTFETGWSTKASLKKDSRSKNIEYLSTADWDWKTRAKDLAERHYPFNLNHDSEREQSKDMIFILELAKKHSYSLTPGRNDQSKWWELRPKEP